MDATGKPRTSRPSSTPASAAVPAPSTSSSSGTSGRCTSSATASSATTKTPAIWRRTCSSARIAGCAVSSGSRRSAHGCIGSRVNVCLNRMALKTPRTEALELARAQRTRQRSAPTRRCSAASAPQKSAPRSRGCPRKQRATLILRVYHELPHERDRRHPRQLGRRGEGKLFSRAGEPEEAAAMTHLTDRRIRRPDGRRPAAGPPNARARLRSMPRAGDGDGVRAGLHHRTPRSANTTCPSRLHCSGITVGACSRRRDLDTGDDLLARARSGGPARHGPPGSRSVALAVAISHSMLPRAPLDTASSIVLRRRPPRRVAAGLELPDDIDADDAWAVVRNVADQVEWDDAHDARDQRRARTRPSG